LGTFADSKPDRWGRELAAFLNRGKVSPDTSLPAPSCQKAWLRSIGAIATDFERIRAGLEPLYNVGIFMGREANPWGFESVERYIAIPTYDNALFSY
jgi:hypothetical protein